MQNVGCLGFRSALVVNLNLLFHGISFKENKWNKWNKWNMADLAGCLSSGGYSSVGDGSNHQLMNCHCKAGFDRIRSGFWPARHEPFSSTNHGDLNIAHPGRVKGSHPTAQSSLTDSPTKPPFGVMSLVFKINRNLVIPTSKMLPTWAVHQIR